MVRVVAGIQARFDSTRLPGKVALPFRGSDSMLEFLIRRLPIPVVVLTSSKQSNDAIQSIAIKCGVPFYRGSEDDVLSRYKHLAGMTDYIVRLTADNPLIDIDSLNRGIEVHRFATLQPQDLFTGITLAICAWISMLLLGTRLILCVPIRCLSLKAPRRNPESMSFQSFTSART